MTPAATKQQLRERVWALLPARGVARFPFPTRHRIPNFVGAERAAARVLDLPQWQGARRLKMNPDAPQRPLRRLALEAGKHVFMAVPRLREARCFLHLDPARLRGRFAEASTIEGAFALGSPVGPEGLGRIDLVVVGSVAVGRDGARLGKGGGYSDLEFALGRRVGAIGPRTAVLTTVHELQILVARIPMTAHDVPVDLVLTPSRVLRVLGLRPKPRGIRWSELDPAQRAAMPVLSRLGPTPRAGEDRGGRGGRLPSG